MELLIGILLAIVVILSYRNIKYRKELDDFGNFLNESIDGEVIEIDFDERESSKLKSQLIKFLNSKQVRESAVVEEKDKTNSLIADISHQTKTPITNLRLYLNLMEKEYRKDYLGVLNHEVEKLEFLVSNLVKSSRLESNIIQLHKEKINLGDLVEDIIKEFEQIARNKDVVIKLKKENIVVNLDERWTKEAIHNLIDNALKYCQKQSIVEVHVYKSYINYNIDVINDGDELLEDEQAKIFQRFYRGRNSKDKDGLGLGLFITREIIENQGGSISVVNKNDKIVFSVNFPI